MECYGEVEVEEEVEVELEGEVQMTWAWLVRKISSRSQLGFLR